MLEPRLTDLLEGDAEMEKSGFVTTSVTVVVWVRVPSVPLIVKV